MDPYAPLCGLLSHIGLKQLAHIFGSETKLAPGSLEESNSASFQGHIGPKGSLLLCAAVSPGATNIYCIDCESPVIGSLQSTLCLLLLCVGVHACLHASTELN